MTTLAVFLNIDEARIVSTLREVGEKLEGIDGEVFLDFSSVRRIDCEALCAMEQLAGRAEEKDLKVVIRDVNVDVYKAIKLMKLADRFSFVN